MAAAAAAAHNGATRGRIRLMVAAALAHGGCAQIPGRSDAALSQVARCGRRSGGGGVAARVLRLQGRSFGEVMEQESPILTNGRMQFCTTSVESISACSITGSTISWIFVGNALATKSCRL
uniref:Uncharacterized protein n=1 Tax=Arundo donax TaxID=35708 RepID=A0A0A9DJJ9_ARUDO